MIRCFCTHQEEAASLKNYHISEHLKRREAHKKKPITTYCLCYFSKYRYARCGGPAYGKHVENGIQSSQAVQD